MAYDADRQVVVLFGGSDYAGVDLMDTWEYKVKATVYLPLVMKR